MTEFGDIIGGRLHAKRWTQMRLAKECGCTSAYISAIVRGVKPGTPELIDKICEALDLTEGERRSLHGAGARDAGFQIGKARGR